MLALDTCFGKFSIALFKDTKEIAFFEGEKENEQAEFLIPEIEKILNAHGIWYQDLSYIAASVGPGSFTGLRIGLAAAKGICLATSVRSIAVSSLEAAAEKKGAWEVYLNANRGEAYYQKNENSEPELVTYSGKLDALPNARDVARVALKKIPNSSPLLPLYVRKPDAKIPVRNS